MPTPWPALDIGGGALGRRSRDWPDSAIATTASAWRLSKHHLVRDPTALLFVDNLQRKTLDAFRSQIRDIGAVVGIGGGLAMDAAKYISKMNGLPLVQVPTTSSNNACFTRTCWVFESGQRLAERNTPIPKQIIVDCDLLAKAPERLNRAGIAEILCSHTSLYDWRLGRDAGLKVDWDPAVEAFTLHELKLLEQLAPAIGRGELEAYIELFHAGARFAPIFSSHPSARFNSGCEHLFGWALERVTGRRLLHGETVALGVLLCAALQHNEPDWAADIVLQSGLRYQPESIGVTWDDVNETFAYLPEFVTSLSWYTLINTWPPSGPDQSRVEAARTFVSGLSAH